MRAIVISASDKTIKEVDLNHSLATLQRLVGGLIDCVEEGLADGHHCWVNDEGLLSGPEHFFMFKDGHQPLPGIGVILAGEQRDAACTLSLDWAEEHVRFMNFAETREWACLHPFSPFAAWVLRSTV